MRVCDLCQDDEGEAVGQLVVEWFGGEIELYQLRPNEWDLCAEHYAEIVGSMRDRANSAWRAQISR